ncbi:6-phosphofructokinase [Priestia abyssalis]|uniref:6-phosphofructokinase n=1 Tax=Priestia abyssalis TaxID=1221450 RepID=UPI0009949BF3|nr:6-phosphofructokinase [Priestia abyssalis]
MRIGIMNIETGHSIVNHLTYDILSPLIHHHEVYGIELTSNKEKVEVKRFGEEDLVGWREYGRVLLRCSFAKEPLAARIFSNFDAVVVMGGNSAYHHFQKITTDETGTKFLFIPVSIYNDIHDSQTSLGYDSALNAVIEAVFKIEDTIQSLKYDQLRLFGIQLPGKHRNALMEDVALAVRGDVIPNYWDVETADYFSQLLKEKVASGQTYSFFIFDERFDSQMIEEKLRPFFMDFTWQTTKIDEAQCMGMKPTAVDRILAKKIAKEVISWVEFNKDAGKLLLQNNKAVFQNQTKLSNILTN